MPKLTTIDRNIAKMLHERLNKAIEESPTLLALAEEFGLTIEPGRAGYDAAQMIITVKFAIAGAVDPMFMELTRVYGLDHTKVAPDGTKLVGYNSRARTMPWQLLCADGKKMKAAEKYVKKYFAADKPDAAEPDHTAR